ncbi:MAG: acyltransferase [Cyanobacteria bacterium SZAS-4]|nr:acyltransferase [Cyanobacteria bacterium SZAS-4]
MRGRVQQLDILRGIGVILILGRHLTGIPPTAPLYLLAFFFRWKGIGWMGVDLFFVLSGYLVTGLMVKEFSALGKFDAKRFLIRRGFKIYPSYYVLLCLTWISIVIGNSKQYPPFTALAQAFFIQNYYPGEDHYPLGHTWSLAVEEHFYLLVAALFSLLVFKQVGLKLFAAVCTLFIIVVPILRFVDLHQDARILNHITHLRLDALFMGSLLACAHHHYGDKFETIFRKNAVILTIASVLLLLPAACYGFATPWTFSLGLTAEQVAFCLIVMLMLVNTKPKGRLATALSTIGFYSYSIYVWHGPIEKLCYFVRVPTNLFILQIAVYCIFSVLGGIAFAKLIETPFLKLRDKHFPRLTKDGPMTTAEDGAPTTA